MSAMTMVKLEIEFDDRDTITVRHPVYRPNVITDATPSVRKRADFAYDGWVRVTIKMGRKTNVITS